MPLSPAVPHRWQLDLKEGVELGDVLEPVATSRRRLVQDVESALHDLTERGRFRVPIREHSAPPVGTDAQILLPLTALANALDEAARGEQFRGGADRAAAYLEDAREVGGTLLRRVTDEQPPDHAAGDERHPLVGEEHRDLVDEVEFGFRGVGHVLILERGRVRMCLHHSAKKAEISPLTSSGRCRFGQCPVLSMSS